MYVCVHYSVHCMYSNREIHPQNTQSTSTRTMLDTIGNASVHSNTPIETKSTNTNTICIVNDDKIKISSLYILHILYTHTELWHEHVRA